jgi:hypothetical protein
MVRTSNVDVSPMDPNWDIILHVCGDVVLEIGVKVIDEYTSLQIIN